MTPADDTTPPEAGRAGIVRFDPPGQAPHLHDTGMMSMPTMDPPAPEQLTAWALPGVRANSAAWKEVAPHG